jgi:REP element-mobilizing transposase RayT
MHHRGAYSRGYLPHTDYPGRTQFVTWRLLDAVTPEIIAKLRAQVSALPEVEARKKVRAEIEKHADCGHGEAVLKDSRAARIVHDAFRFGQCERYMLNAWAIMPNHIHLLLTPCEGWPLGRIIGDLKSFTAKEINKTLNRQGSLWQEESYDRFIRDWQHFERTMSYIEWNPSKPASAPIQATTTARPTTTRESMFSKRSADVPVRSSPDRPRSGVSTSERQNPLPGHKPDA